MLIGWWVSPPRHGAVVERVEARVLDVAAGGCRLETRDPLPIGYVAVVEIVTPHARITEVARVCDSRERVGAANRYVAHVEFLPVPMAQRASALAAMRDGLGEANASLVEPGELSGSGQTRPTRLALVPRPELDSSAHKSGPRSAERNWRLHTAALAAPLNIQRPVDVARMGDGLERHGEPAHVACRNEGLDAERKDTGT